MIRSGYEIEDIQSCLVALLKSKTSAPWSSWEVIEAWPANSIFAKIAKPIIYVDRPAYAGEIDRQHMGGAPGTIWECSIGLWDDNRTGGSEEIGIMQSQLLAFFRAKPTVHQATFNITLGATAYTATTIFAQGFRIKSIGPERTVDNDAENNNFRLEHMITIIS